VFDTLLLGLNVTFIILLLFFILFLSVQLRKWIQRTVRIGMPQFDNKNVEKQSDKLFNIFFLTAMC
jgi:hypothetical protein